MTAASWLRELGAVRPMAPVGQEVLVLGKWRDGHYPIQWTKHPLKRVFASMVSDEWIDATAIMRENWTVFGIPTARPLTREDCERILRAVEEKE